LLNIVNFCPWHEKWMKVGQILSGTLTKLRKNFSFHEILFCFVLLMNKLICIAWNFQIAQQSMKSCNVYCRSTICPIFLAKFWQPCSPSAPSCATRSSSSKSTTSGRARKKIWRRNYFWRTHFLPTWLRLMRML